MVAMRMGSAGLGLLLSMLGALAGILFVFGLERWLRQPGLANLLVAVGLVVAAVLGWQTACT